MVQKILLVEDDSNIASIYAFLLTDAGNTVQLAKDGPDALKQVLSFQPDVILLDIMIPEIDGLEVLRIIRSDPTYGHLHPKVIVMTNLMQENAKERAEKYGAEGYVVKANISANDLIPIIEDLQSQPGSGGVQATANPPGTKLVDAAIPPSAEQK